MGNIGKPIKRLELVPLPEDIPLPEELPGQPAPEPERERPREPVRVGGMWPPSPGWPVPDDVPRG